MVVAVVGFRYHGTVKIAHLRMDTMIERVAKESALILLSIPL